MKVNPNEAPAGYVAVEYVDCSECAFDNDNASCCSAVCYPDSRQDHCIVMFIAKEITTEQHHTDRSQFENELLKSIADKCGFILSKSNLQENIREVEFFASKVFEAGVEFGKQQANKEIH